MKKKFFIITTLLVILSLLTVSYTFAATNIVNDVRNVVGGAENVIEDAGKDAANGIRDGVNAIGNGVNDIGNDAMNGNISNNMSGIDNGSMRDNTRTTTDTGYEATRTATDNGMLGGISNSVWTWLIVAILAIAIVALVMYYARQNTNVTIYHHDDDENK